MKRERKGEAAPGKGMEIPYQISPDGNQVRIVAGLQGVSEGSIRLDLEKTTLFISATGEERRYEKNITLPWEARLAAKRFRNGVLELTLERSDR
jgi:HSP20 family molecular chaperone IbpA